MNLLPFERVAETRQRHNQIVGIHILASQGSAVVVSTSSVYAHIPPTERLFSNTVTENPSSRRFFRAARPDGPANGALALASLKKELKTYQRQLLLPSGFPLEAVIWSERRSKKRGRDVQ